MNLEIIENTRDNLDFKFGDKLLKVVIERGHLCLFVPYELSGYTILAFEHVEVRESLNTLLGNGVYLNVEFYTSDDNSMFTICNIKEKDYITLRKELVKFAELNGKKIPIRAVTK